MFVQDVGEGFVNHAPRTKEEFAVYCSLFLNVRFPHPKVCENHQSPLDAIWAAYSEEDDSLIWYAMRGSGKTYKLSCLTYMESIFKPKCGITILGGSLEQSQRAIGYLGQMWSLEHAPKHLLSGGSVAGRGYKLNNGSWVTALAASGKSVRGPHPAKLRLDEVDEMDEQIYQSSLGQPKANFGIKDNILISSTLHHPFGLMSEIIDNRFETGHKLYQWCVEEVKHPNGFWSKEEIERRKRQITQVMWEAEYELKRPKMGDSIWDFITIDKAWQRGQSIDYHPKVICEAGIDWGHTCTVLNIIQDMKECINVPESYSWEYMELTERCEEITDICIDKRIEILYCDSNPKDAHITLKKVMLKKRCPTLVVPVAFNKWKDISIDVIRYYLEKNLINIKDKVLQDKMKKYHYKDKDLEIIDKIDDHFPDALIAWASSRWRILGYIKEA
jgi:hypothetical protein